MKISVDRQVLNIEGKPFDPPVTLRAALLAALLNPIGPRNGAPGDESLSLDHKLKLHRLASRVSRENDGGVVELSAEDITEIKQRAAVNFSIQLLGQVNEMLEEGANRTEKPT